MRNLRTLIQSPVALFAFEAAARHMSFTRAAQELNVTQAAVSYNVRQLETALGVRLFHREHRSVRLTETGEKFFHDVSMGLTHIRRSAEGIAQRADDNQVTLSCSTSFANYWLVPRLVRFREENPDIDLRVQTTDKDLDIVAEGISLGVRQGLGTWPGCEAEKLADEAIYPVASPAYLAAKPVITGPADLLGHELIHLDEPYRPCASWVEWFNHFSIPWRDDGRGLHINDHALALQAAMAGDGIALGWRHLVEGLIEQELLEYAIPTPFTEERHFYVIWAADREERPAVETVRAWLLR